MRSFKTRASRNIFKAEAFACRRIKARNEMRSFKTRASRNIFKAEAFACRRIKARNEMRNFAARVNKIQIIPAARSPQLCEATSKPKIKIITK